ncbi:gamma-glutamyl-gamma-aminobutyrate hydrolase family protein [Halarchaeum sp. CBA1220]|uniref:type 1 glutamine amidotransferase n=1 Tax=Halarchaeum sp. CBA1220 TaxID=1853682 RepID=UPI000F3A8304|nr:type 1 glutamine amidotransferase [Halarchaeum sp. CBA1220]QLC34662.1 gamma-glutamyl-gamma-aminobutyrate hydrolase family protein [Halarchaeum sp. CBA1220]
MERLRIALLNAAHDPADTARNFRREVDADLVEFHAAGGELPEDYDFDAAIVTGSRASVYWDEEEWIAPTREWVARAHERGLPILGVCFGHQLVAAALGGTVEGMDEYEIGYRDVTHDGSDRLFDGVDSEFTVFTTHSDAVTELPPNAELLAENDYGVHAFRRGNAYGVQFHPEYDTETAERVTVRKDDLAEERKAAVLDGITAENYDAACEAKRLFDNFCAFAAARTPRAAD